jgi:hypothetical protein
VSFTDTSGSYNAGASVSVAITHSQTGDTLSVPSRAVTTANSTSTVEVSTSGGTETRTVTTGVTVGGMTQITSGLSAGESVVIAGPGGGAPTRAGSASGGTGSDLPAGGQLPTDAGAGGS